MKRGLIFSLYSPGRERLQQELEESLQQDFLEFDFITLPPAAERRFMAPNNAEGYDYARDNGYEYVARIDDDDLIIPGALTLFMEILDADPTIDGCGGRQEQFRGEVPHFQLSSNPEITYKTIYDKFHGVTLYRVDRLYPILDDWRNVKDYDIHRSLVKRFKQNKRTLGYVEETTSLWRRRNDDNRY